MHCNLLHHFKIFNQTTITITGIFIILFLYVTDVSSKSLQIGNNHNQICKEVFLFRICGDTSTFKKKLSQSDDMVNFSKAEISAHEQVTSALKKQDPTVSINKLSSNDIISRKWVQMTDILINSLSYNYLFFESQRFSAKIDPISKVKFQAIKDKMILMSVNLNEYPNYLTVYKQQINQLCEETLKRDNSYRHYSQSQFSAAIQECYLSITGNFEQAWERNEPKAVKGLYYLIVSLWAGEIFGDELRTYLSNHPRPVYLIYSKKPLSPRVNSMGYLYLPDRLLREKSESDLHLIMLHEAAHIRLFTWEKISKILFSILPNELIEEDLEDIEDRKSKVNKAIRALMRMLGQMVEIFTDAHVLFDIFHDKQQRYRYQQLISESEVLYPDRIKALKLLNQLADTLNQKDVLLHLEEVLIFQDNALKAKIITQEQLNILKEFQKIHIAYIAALQIGGLPEYTDEFKDSGLDPMKLEDQMTSLLIDSFRHFERLRRE